VKGNPHLWDVLMSAEARYDTMVRNVRDYREWLQTRTYKEPTVRQRKLQAKLLKRYIAREWDPSKRAIAMMMQQYEISHLLNGESWHWKWDSMEDHKPVNGLPK
jgi:hypothetical protein